MTTKIDTQLPEGDYPEGTVPVFSGGSKPKKTELILAVRTAGLPPELYKTGMHPMGKDKVLSTLNEAGLFLGPRYLLEDMPEFMQIIPYNVLVDADENIVYYTRTAQGGESRLHGRVSIGVGGHIDLVDVSPQDCQQRIHLEDTIWTASSREIYEELGTHKYSDSEYIGLLVDLSDDVGKVHIGVVLMSELSAEAVLKTEDALDNVSFGSLDTLIAMTIPGSGVQTEKWSEMVLYHFAKFDSM